MRAARCLVYSILLGGGFTACSQLPPTHFYLLELPGSPAGEQRAPAARDWAIAVRPLLVDAPYDQSGIAYRVGESSPEIGFYAYHHWAAPLSVMVPRLIAEGLAPADGVGRIEPELSGSAYDAHLDGRIVAVEEIDVAGEQRVRLDIELRLVGQDGEPVWHHALMASGSTATSEVEAIVRLMGEALGRALQQARPSLEAALAARPH